MAMSMRTELERRRDRQWLASYLCLMGVLPLLSLVVLVPSVLGKGVVAVLGMTSLLAGIVLARCARELDVLLSATAPRRTSDLREA